MCIWHQSSSVTSAFPREPKCSVYNECKFHPSPILEMTLRFAWNDTASQSIVCSRIAYIDRATEDLKIANEYA